LCHPTVPWDPVKQFSGIVGRTCSDIFHNNPATVVEFFLPMQDYLPGHHVPDIYAHACEDIKELVKMEKRATISNEDILDLAFVLHPGFMDGKTNMYFLGWKTCFFAGTNGASQKMHSNLVSFLVTVMGLNGCPNRIKDTFPKHVFDWIGLIQEHCHHGLCHYRKARKLLSFHTRIQFSTGCLGIFV